MADEKDYDDLNEDPDAQLDDDEMSAAEAGFTKGAEEEEEEEEKEEGEDENDEVK